MGDSSMIYDQVNVIDLDFKIIPSLCFRLGLLGLLSLSFRSYDIGNRSRIAEFPSLLQTKILSFNLTGYRSGAQS